MYDGESLKRLLFSQYLYSGIQAAAGVALVAVLCDAQFGLAAALIAAVGAVCVSIVDLPNPPHQKFYQTFAAAILGTCAMLIMACVTGHVWQTGAAVLVIGFGSGMLQSYGRQVLPLSFTLLFVVVIAIGSPPVPREDILIHTGLFGLGALGYMVYSLFASWALALRTKQQALAESMFTLATYLRVRSRFYEPGADLDACYRALVEQQMVVVEKQQATRDLVLRRVVTMQDVRLVGCLLASLDVFERIFSSSTDYELLQTYFAGSDAMLFLRDLAEKGAQDLEELAYSIAGRRRAPRKISYKAERLALEYEMGRLGTPEHGPQASLHAIAVLRGVVERMLHGIAQIQELHSVSRSNLTRAQILGGQSFRPFLTSFSFSPAVMRSQLTPASPVFRFAVRLSAAMLCGFVLAHTLPYATHSYWILLTIAVVLRSSFTLTQQRRNDRIVGTVVGGTLTAAFLYFGPPSWLQMALLFTALGTAHTFATIRYRYTAVAASILALLQVHLINPAAVFTVPERLIDTFVGALLAFGFSFVWPSWERQSIPLQIERLLACNLRYVETVLGGEAEDMAYRLARKQLFDAIAALTGSFRRMLSEPRSHHRAVKDLNEFITLDYLLTAHATAVHLLFEHQVVQADNLEISEDLDATREDVNERLRAAIDAWSTRAPLPDERSGETAPPQANLETDSQWTAGMVLQRRLRLIRQTAAGVCSLSQRIARQW